MDDLTWLFLLSFQFCEEPYQQIIFYYAKSEIMKWCYKHIPYKVREEELIISMFDTG